MSKKKLKMTHRFRKQAQDLPQEIKNSMQTNLEKLIEDPFYNSLHTKKIKGTNIFSSRINKQYRFSWQFKEGNIIILRNVDKHDDLYNSPEF